MLPFLTSLINQLLPEPEASLLAGMLFGVKKTMPDDFYQALVATGTLHVIALSGMNISIITRLLFDMLGSYLGKVKGVGVTVIGIAGFIYLVGASPSVVRAGIMGFLTMMSVLVGRKDVPLISLFLTGMIMVLFHHEIVYSISFQLSFMATFGIILFGGEQTERKSDISKTLEKNREFSYYKIKHIFHFFLYELIHFIRSDIRISLSAQIFTMPIIFYYFHRISIISPLANGAISWLIAPITYLGFLMVFAALLWQPLGRLFAIFVWAPLALFVWIVQQFSSIPMASFSF